MSKKALSSADELPAFSPRIAAWFIRYLKRYFARNFTAVRLSLSGSSPQIGDGPIVVYSNHPGWWDPIFFFLLGAAVFPGREGYGPMDAEALRKYGIFKRLGVFGIERDTRAGAVRFLRTARAVLARPGAILWITAEGEFTDPRSRPVRIAPGIAHLARSVERLVLVPLALEYPFWNERRPEALARFGRPVQQPEGESRSSDEWLGLLEQRLEENMDQLAAEARSRDPKRFRTLVGGKVGVGGVYDAWRRLRAALRGKRFDAAHGDEDPR